MNFSFVCTSVRFTYVQTISAGKRGEAPAVSKGQRSEQRWNGAKLESHVLNEPKVDNYTKLFCFGGVFLAINMSTFIRFIGIFFWSPGCFRSELVDRVHVSTLIIYHPFICLLSSHRRVPWRGGGWSRSLITMLSVRKLFSSSSSSCGGKLAVRTGRRAGAVDLCTTRRPYGVAHGPPLINKWRAHPGGQPSSAGPFAAAISGLAEIQNGHTLCLPVRRLLTLSLVMGKRTRNGKGGGTKTEGGGIRRGHDWPSSPSPLLISVSDKVEQRVHSGLHNKSIRE